MLDYLRPFHDASPDAFYFLPSDENKITLESMTYKDFGIKSGGSELGDEYHVILFKEDEEGYVQHLDMFDAVLVSPYHYLSRLMPMGWLGLIAKKTTTSYEFVKATFDKLSEVDETE